MDKALQMGKVSATGSFQLFIGKTVSTIIMAAGTVILTRLMLPEEYGLYSIALMPYMMISLFQDWGVSSAMIKYIAQSRTQNKHDDINDIITAGLTFKITMGIAMSLLSLLLANFIASTIFHRPESAPLIAIASITLFSTSLFTASQATFTGHEKMQLNSLTMTCHAILKSTAAPLLVLLGYGTLGAVLGHTLSFLAASIIGIITLYFTLYRNRRRTTTKKPKISKTLKMMLHYGVPLSISTILAGFLIQFRSFMMAFFCSDIMIGNYRAATNFAVLLTFFTFPIATVLFPAFAKLNPQNEKQLLKDIFATAVKYTALLLVPATMAVMVLSEPMISTLFGQKWTFAPLFLTLYVTGNLFVIFGGLVMGNLLTGLGETKTLMKLSLLTLSLGLPLAFLLIPTFGIVGVILGGIFAGLPSMFLGLYWIWKHYQTKADFKSSIKIFIASAAAATITYLPLTFIHTADWIELTIGGTIFLTTYAFAAPLIGAINQKDINNLRTMLSGLGIISKLVNIPLVLAEKLIGLNPAKRN